MPSIDDLHVELIRFGLL